MMANIEVEINRPSQRMSIRGSRSYQHFTSAPALIAIVLLSTIVFITLFAPFIAPYDPIAINMSERLEPISKTHWLGTDTLGRDVFSRIVHGGRISLLLAVVAALSTMLIGLVVGTIAGYFGGWLDEVIQAVVNVFQGLPGLSFMLAIAGVLGPSAVSLLIAIMITSWADFSRIVRGEVLKLREESYIEGIRALGASQFYLLTRHLIPNMMGPLIVLFTLRIGRIILAIAALSFLGLGLQPPAPDWGVMVTIHDRISAVTRT